MSDIVVKAEEVGKHYLIAHEQAERYTALRDVVTNSVKNIFRKQASVSKEEFWALKDVSFDIRQGERVGIIGRNGAGKSTLLKILSRITEPSKGRITLKGRVASLLEVGTGFHPELTGRENVFLNGAILGMSRMEIRKKFDEIVEFAEVERFLDTPVKRYSSGMYVRLAFSVAAHLEPEILIVDEVLAVGDAQFQQKCLGKMEDVSVNGGRTVLFVSHSMGVMAQLCNKAILLRKGVLSKVDEVKKVIEEYTTNRNVDTIVYTNDKASSGFKNLFFLKIYATDESDVAKEHFQFDESIFLNISIHAKHIPITAKISVTLQNTMGDYLSTFIEGLNDFSVNGGEIKMLIQLPASVIAPNSYFFRFALFSPGAEIYDLVELICPVKISDTGTSMSLLEGYNYGSFFMNYNIHL